jgi:hypothetical protein
MKHLLPLFLLFLSAFSAQAQCDCPEESTPVCAIDENGQFFVMANACEAECYNLEVLPNETCLGDFDLSNPNCLEEVCVVDVEGNAFVLPICLAEGLGMEVVGFGDCSVNENDGGGDEFDYCEQPVCAVDVDGNLYNLPYCEAEALGLLVLADGSCDGVEIEDGGDEEEDNVNYCDQLVCSLDELGNFQSLSICEAEALNYTILYDDVCEELFNVVEEGNGSACEEQVCVINPNNGLIIEQSICFAEVLGWPIVGQGDCSDIVIEDTNDEDQDDYCDQIVCAFDNMGEFYSLSICEAELLGLNLVFDGNCAALFNEVYAENGELCDTEVCTINPEGEVILLSLCLAEIIAWPIVGEGDCSDIVIDETDEGTNGNADCETMVCIQTPEGEIFQQPLCIAEILGFEILDSDACDLDIEVDPTGGTGAEGLDDDDCETMVCILTPEGEIFQQPYCIAVLNDFEILAPGNCDVDLIDDEIAGGEELDPNDCETLVCMITPEGQIFTQPYCLAILLGFEIIGDGNCLGLNEEEEPIDPLDMEDLGAWLYETLGVFIDHNEGFEIIEVRGSGAGSYDIELAADHNEFVQLQVSDMNGRLVVDRTVDVSEGRAIPQIDLSQQESGVYILRILGDNNVETLKIMHVK